MDFFFPEDGLARAVPEETKLNSLTAQPYPDGYRLRVNIEITPFQKRPYIEVILKDANGDEVASTSIVEPLTVRLPASQLFHLGDAFELHRNPVGTADIACVRIQPRQED